jgi:Zn-dependent peptidase ImmA (M78 family)
LTANYSKAVLSSVNVLKDYNYNEVPINLDILIKELRRTIKVCSYSKLSKKKGVTIDEICTYFESDLGACAYERNTERYIIFYNDTKNNIGLKRFTIAHELGHIFLNHHNKADTDIMLRKGITEKKYKVFENEANCFARNFLAPYYLVSSISKIDFDVSKTDAFRNDVIQDLMNGFNISHDAAITRIKFYPNDRYYTSDKFEEYFSEYKINYGYYCLTCKNAEDKPTKFCRICGKENNFFEKGTDRVYYSDGVETDENLRVTICPICENEEISEKAEFCRICGITLYNMCDGHRYEDENGDFLEVGYHKNSSNSRFCETCGEPTTYYKKSVLCDYTDFGKATDNSDDSDDELPF